MAWDDCCSLPFPSLDRLLTVYSEQEPEAGDVEIESLIDHYPSQRMMALRARACLLAREAGRVDNLARLGEDVARLPEGSAGFLVETPRLVEMVGEIVGRQARLDAADRPIFREPYAEAVLTAVETFQNKVAGFHEPLASEFRAATVRWKEVAERQREEVRRRASREPTSQVFRAGDPVDRDREAFVPRDGVVGRLEQQVMLATGCPGIVLYGRRRMGKSTVLRNLGGFLAGTGRGAVIVSMQESEAFASEASLCELLGRRVRGAWPGGAPTGEAPGDRPGLARLLEDCNRALASEGRRLILAFDEYENIDRKIGEGVIPEDLLAMVRESIQSHRNLTWVFAGSHEIEELTAAPWTSYLVSARTIEVEPFTADETRLLLTEPLKSCTIWPSGRERPRFSTQFWGEGGIARVHAEAGGWPHLVQLIAETLVDRLNLSGRGEVDADDWEPALDEAVVRGHNVFYELLIRESRIVGELAYLRGFRTRETQPLPDDDAIERSLGAPAAGRARGRRLAAPRPALSPLAAVEGLNGQLTVPWAPEMNWLEPAKAEATCSSVNWPATRRFTQYCSVVESVGAPQKIVPKPSTARVIAGAPKTKSWATVARLRPDDISDVQAETSDDDACRPRMSLYSAWTNEASVACAALNSSEVSMW